MRRWPPRSAKGWNRRWLREVIDDYLRFAVQHPKAESNLHVRGIVLKVDKFGNLVTIFRLPTSRSSLNGNRPLFVCLVGKAEIRRYI